MQRPETVVPLDRPVRRPLQALLPSTGSSPSVIPFAGWQKACDRASAALLGGDSRVVVAGPPGTGKTLLLDHVARVLRTAGWTVVLRLADATPLPPQGGNVALLIDEADRLSRESLQQLLAAARCPVVLAGLDMLLSRVEGATQIVLRPLGREEARDYVASWLTQTGREPSNLEAAAMRRTVEISGGVPRLASTLLSAAAWLAESAAEPIITIRHIEEAAALRSCFVPGEPEVEPAAEAVRERTNTPLLVALAATTLLLGAGAYVATRYYPVETERAVDSVRDAALRVQSTIDQTLNGPKPVQPAAVATPAAPRPAEPILAAAVPEIPKVGPPQPAPLVSPQPQASASTEIASTEIAASRPQTVAIEPEPAPVAPPAPEAAPPAPDAAAPPAPDAAPPLPAPTVFVPAAPVVASAKPPANPRSLPPETIGLLLRRGNDMMSIGDISAARLLFIRAADAGSAEAMLAVGRTYDPFVLAQASPHMVPDPAEAARWYRRAAKAGNRSAEDLLDRADR